MHPTRLANRLLHTRALVRAPITLYRHDLGWLLGRRFLLLEHRGRRSGRWRQVVLECLALPAPDRIRVIAGLGRRSQWYRNVSAEPRVRVTVGADTIEATAHELDPQEGAAQLAAYSRDHPRAAAILFPVLERNLPAGQTVAQAYPVIELRLQRGPEALTAQAWHQLVGPIGPGQTLAIGSGAIACAAMGVLTGVGPRSKVLRGLAGGDIGGGLVAFALPTTRHRYAAEGPAARWRFAAAHLHPLLLVGPRRALAAYLGMLGGHAVLRRLPSPARVPVAALVVLLLTLAERTEPDPLLVAYWAKLLVGHGSVPDGARPEPGGVGAIRFSAAARPLRSRRPRPASGRASGRPTESSRRARRPE